MQGSMAGKYRCGAPISSSGPCTLSSVSTYLSLYYRQQGLLAGMLISVLTLLVLVCIYMRDPEWPHVSRT
jgi:hypothetical protein